MLFLPLQTFGCCGCKCYSNHFQSQTASLTNLLYSPNCQSPAPSIPPAWQPQVTPAPLTTEIIQPNIMIYLMNNLQMEALHSRELRAMTYGELHMIMMHRIQGENQEEELIFQEKLNG